MKSSVTIREQQNSTRRKTDVLIAALVRQYHIKLWTARRRNRKWNTEQTANYKVIIRNSGLNPSLLYVDCDDINTAVDKGPCML